MPIDVTELAAALNQLATNNPDALLSALAKSANVQQANLKDGLKATELSDLVGKLTKRMQAGESYANTQQNIANDAIVAARVQHVQPLEEARDVIVARHITVAAYLKDTLLPAVKNGTVTNIPTAAKIQRWLDGIDPLP